MSEEGYKYIKEMRAAGFSDEEIKERLSGAGWTKEHIDSAFAMDLGAPVISIKNLKKHYGDVRAVDGVTFSVQRGEIFGFLGPNGAGKTTTIRTMLDFLRPTSGTVTILGHDSKNGSTELRENVGYLSGNVNLFNAWTGKEHVEFSRKLNRGRDITEELYTKLNFDPTRKVKELSSGNKQKLGIILALMSDPDVLILDEPTNALDPILQNTVYKLLEEAVERGVTVFMSSHNLTEVERVCHRVGIIKDGKMIEIDSIKNLQEKRLYSVWISFEEDIDINTFQREGIQLISEEHDGFTFRVQRDINEFMHVASKYRIKDMRVNRASLENIFLEFYE